MIECHALSPNKLRLSMKTKFTLIIMLLLSMSMILNTADARRFGGGRSLGKSWSSQSHSVSKPYNSGRSSILGGKMKGALMGLVAGGLIGSLLFGGGFNGFQGLDFLLIAGLAFLVFRLLRARQTAITGASNHHYAAQSQQAAPQQQNNTHFDSAAPSTTNTSSPAWFDEMQFAQGAKQHYMALQRAWDSGDMESIRSYCSPEFFQEVQTERNKLSGQQFTEILSLETRLIEVQELGVNIIAGIEFKAMLREDKDSSIPAKEVIEVWSIQHNKDSAEGDWLIVGITQD